jgi:hypothetical protein
MTMFRTEITIEPSQEKINHDQKILSLGSCFSEIMGRRLERYKFDVLQNPFGTIFHPLAITRFFHATEDAFLDKNNFVSSQDVWHHYWCHSELSSPDQTTLFQACQQAIHHFLK